MNDVLKTVVKYGGLAFGALVLAFTAWQSFDLVLSVTNNNLQALLALVLFDIGAFYWFLVAFKEAEGKLQMALAFIMFGLSLGLVILTVALQLGAVSADILGSNSAAKLITVAAIIHLIAKYLMPLVSVENLREINRRARRARLDDMIDKKLDEKMDAIAEELADERAEQLLDQEREAIRKPVLLEDGRKKKQISASEKVELEFIPQPPLEEVIHPNGRGPENGHQ